MYRFIKWSKSLQLFNYALTVLKKREIKSVILWMYTFIKEQNNYWQLNYNKEFKLYKKVMFLLVFLIVKAWINEMNE